MVRSHVRLLPVHEPCRTGFGHGFSSQVFPQMFAPAVLRGEINILGHSLSRMNPRPCNEPLLASTVYSFFFGGGDREG